MEYSSSSLIYRIAFVLIFMASACKPAQHTYQPLPPKTENSGKMIFLSFSVQSDSLKASQIQLIGKKVIEENLKSSLISSNLEDRLVVKQLNSQLFELSSDAIDHPLLRRAEFSNEQGKLERRLVKLDNAEFFVRVTLMPETEYIRIEEIVGNESIGTTTFKIKD